MTTLTDTLPGAARMTHPRPDTREALLDAAEKLFVERGYAAVGIREIVERAGANIAAIKYHFGSKSKLYVETVRRAVHRNGCADSWSELQSSSLESPGQAACALSRFVHRFLVRLLSPTSASAACGLIAREAAEPSEAMKIIVSDFIRPHQRLLVSVLRAISSTHSDSDLLLTAETLVAQLLHFRTFRPIIERSGVVDLSRPSDIERVASHIVRGVLRQLLVDESLIAETLANSSE